MKRGLLFVALLLVKIPLLAQSRSVELYNARVITYTGRNVRGILHDASETHIQLTEVDQGLQYGDAIIPLTNVKRVIIRRQRKRGAALTGAVIGGLVTDYFVVQSAKKNPFGNPVSYGISLVFAAGAGASLGAIVGQKLGRSSRRVIRPAGQDPEIAVENLRRQLTPFTYNYQNKLLNRVRP